jgi:glycine betaine catabolism A
MVIQPSADFAPLVRAELERSLLPFGQSRMLPRSAYVDPAVFAWEQRHFFDGGWMCIGRSEDLGEPGDQRAESLGSAGALLIRGQDGVLRAFANVCSHRGHELLPCGVSTRHGRVICPYHSWSYTLQGDVWTAPGFKELEGFDPAEHGLTQLPCTEWHGLVFVDGSGTASALEVQLASLEELVRPYEPERLRVAGSHDYTVAANWKILTENYQECYHCPMIHPELCEVSPPKSGGNYHLDGPWVGGTMDLREGMDTMSLDGKSGGVMLRGLDAEGLRSVIYVYVFPNVLISLHPDYVMTHRLIPLAADSTRIVCTWSFAPEAVEQPGFDPAYAVNFWDITNQQDWEACSSVQRGLASTHARPGPMGGEEDAVYQFVTMIARGYQGQPITNTASGLPSAGISSRVAAL